MATENYRVNEEIKSKEVRVIGEDGEQLGVLSIKEALQKAEELGVDLVEVSPNAEPPVCRLIDYGKFLYQKEKKAKEAKKKQKVVEIKEFKLRPWIDNHDFAYRIEQMKEFLTKGDKVKITVRFRGRELSHIDLGFQLTEKVVNELAGSCVVEKPAKMEGKNITLVLGPAKQKK
ncbi:MAG: translation initiation factor IF-3 [Brevinematales bacterium]|nr:translation initiation factor IF-3 [Brevinematales bacterium]